jgi:hypothetical protein
MNLKKLCRAGLLVAGGMLLASASYAQAPQFVAVGSSGIFPSMGIAAVTQDPITLAAPACGTNFWSTKTASGFAGGLDSRGGTIPEEFGNLWVAWDNSTTPTVVCAFLSVDSIVGLRLFYGQGASTNATLSLSSAATSTPGANAVSFVTDTATTGLPTPVYNLVNGAHFNIVFTDIRPEDGQFAYGRAACNRAGVTDVSCFGYGPAGGVGTAINSSYSRTSAQVVAFSISGTDPISGLSIPASTTLPVGAEPVVLFYNKTDTATGGLGSILPKNINATTASLVWSGLVGLTDQIAGFSTGSAKVLHVVEREPVSGTYNTFEWQVVHTRDAHGGDFSQEYGFGPTPAGCFTPPATATYVPPTVACANPANAAGTQGSTYGGFRTRAIGTGEMVAAVNSTNNPNSIGYAFWSVGSLAGKTNINYLTLDGADPLYSSYSVSNGAFPTCSGAFNLGTFACTGTLPTFDNVKNGGYRAFNIMRAAYYKSYVAPTTGPSITTLILAAQDQAEINLPDIVPSVYCANASCSSTTTGLGVFRSHYPIDGLDANNGTTSASTGFCAADQTAPNCIEEGGDMAGKVFLSIQDQEYFALTGNEFLTWIQ